MLFFLCVCSTNEFVQAGENKWDGAESLMDQGKSDLHFITSLRAALLDICMQKSVSKLLELSFEQGQNNDHN